LMHELRGEPEPSLKELLARMSQVDLVLVEGFKRDSHPKLEIHRPSVGKPLLQPEDRHIVGVASDTALEVRVPLLDLSDVARIAQFVLANAIPVGSRELPRTSQRIAAAT
jgi:molybdopterin-guanine dinucleotide biosynthesis adapter protein